MQIDLDTAAWRISYGYDVEQVGDEQWHCHVRWSGVPIQTIGFNGSRSEAERIAKDMLALRLLREGWCDAGR